MNRHKPEHPLVWRPYQIKFALAAWPTGGAARSGGGKRNEGAQPGEEGRGKKSRARTCGVKGGSLRGSRRGRRAGHVADGVSLCVLDGRCHPTTPSPGQTLSWRLFVTITRLAARLPPRLHDRIRSCGEGGNRNPGRRRQPALATVKPCRCLYCGPARPAASKAHFNDSAAQRCSCEFVTTCGSSTAAAAAAASFRRPLPDGAHGTKE